MVSVTIGISEIPRAACFKPEDMFNLLTNCGNFVFGLGKTVGDRVAHHTIAEYGCILMV